MAKMGEQCDCSECMKKAKCPHCDGNAPRSKCICGGNHNHEMEKGGAKPDFLDLDGDGNRTESMKEASRDAEKKALGAVTSQSNGMQSRPRYSKKKDEE